MEYLRAQLMSIMKSRGVEAIEVFKKFLIPKKAKA